MQQKKNNLKKLYLTTKKLTGKFKQYQVHIKDKSNPHNQERSISFILLDWKDGIIVKNPKKGSLAKKHQGILLLSTPGKVLNHYSLLQRLQKAIDLRLRENQASFRNGRSCADFADGIALPSHSHQQMQDKSHKIERTAATIRLKIKTSKTKVMRINNNAPIIQFKKVDGFT